VEGLCTPFRSQLSRVKRNTEMEMRTQLLIGCLLGVLLCCRLSDATHSHYCTTDDYMGLTPTRGVCGNNLVQFMSLICKDKFYYPSMKRAGQLSKRSVMRGSSNLGKLDNDNSDDPTSEKGVFLDRKNAIALLSKRSESRGIICECCIHQCDVEEMRGYCQVDR